MQHNYTRVQFVPITWYVAGNKSINIVGRDRFQAYGFEGVPSAMFSGEEEIVGGHGDGSSMFPIYQPIIEDLLHHSSPLSITSHHTINGLSGTLQVTIEVIQPITTTDNRVHFVIVEDKAKLQVYFAREMLEDEPCSLNAIGDTVTIVREFEINQSWISDNLYIIVFVQSHGEALQVLQATQSVRNQE